MGFLKPRRPPSAGRRTQPRDNSFPVSLSGHRQKRRSRPAKIGQIAWLPPFDPLKKDAFLGIPMLIGMKNIPVAFVNPSGDPSYQTPLIGTEKHGND